MNRRVQTVLGLALVVAGVTGLFGLQALGAPRPDVAPIEAAAAAPAATVAAQRTTADTDPGLRQRVREMVRDHMGLSGSDGDEWADEMLEHMAAVHGDQTGAMLDYCGGWVDTAPGGSPGATDDATDGATGESPAGGGPAGGGWGGMMGGGASGGMMDGWN